MNNFLCRWKHSMVLFKYKFNKFLYYFFWVLITFFVYHKLSFANILIEPFGGISLKGEVEKSENSTSGSDKWSYMAPSYGFRLASDYLGIYLGGEAGFMLQTWKGVEPINPGVNDNPQKLNGSYLGIVLAYFFPFGVIFRANYYTLANFQKRDSNGAFDAKDTYQGLGYGLGLGYRILPFLAINGEYRSFYLDKLKSGKNGERISLKDGREVSMSEILVSISFPIIF